MEYYIFHPRIRGKQRWAYWYYDAGMKRRQVYVNPDTKEPFEKKEDVKRYLAALRKSAADILPSVTVEQLGKVMFQDGSDWSVRRGRKRGKPISPQTMAVHRGMFEKYLVPEWGKMKPGDVKHRAFEEWLFTFDLSQSTRRAIGQTMGLLLREAEGLGFIEARPQFELPSREKVARVALTMEELKKLFPVSLPDRREMWRLSKKDRPRTADLAAAFGAVMFFGGLRPQEARALHTEQIDFGQQAIFVTQSIDNQNLITPYLKTSTTKDPRHRFTFVAKRGMDILQWFITEYDVRGQVFTIDGEVVNRGFITSRLRKAARKAKVSQSIVGYSGRYTFQTLLRGSIPKDQIMLLMGHRDETSPDEYDRPQLVDRVQQMNETSSLIDRVFGTE